MGEIKTAHTVLAWNPEGKRCRCW